MPLVIPCCSLVVLPSSGASAPLRWSGRTRSAWVDNRGPPQARGSRYAGGVPPPVDILELQEALAASWIEETAQAAPHTRWSPERPATGQCCVSTMVLQHYLGGRIVRGVTNKGGVHYWNELPGGSWYDSTRSQFDEDEHVVEHVVDPEAHLYRFRETFEKYELLLGRVQERLAKGPVGARRFQ